MALQKAKSHGLTVKFLGFETKEKTFYKVQVSHEGETWELSKRYSDFYFFHANLDKKYAKLAFPPKSLGSLTAEQQDERQQKLKEWFTEFLAMPMTPQAIAQLQSFLRATKHVKQQRGVRNYPGTILKAGYLQKLAGTKGSSNWKKRYVVLTDSLLVYETEDVYENGGAPKGAVSLNCIYCPTPEDDLEFTLHALPVDFVARAESKDDRDEWVSLFQHLRSC
ncbi:hypothetical protein CTAYLR_007740 [Chrysophaeum taylorii]|uniref:Uncharacterized protein n=1 Tax=Chrysophaeum taylorii TaxID=2483200 RepID=A0AAD7ULK3_9STRA|nr:hypothetical protein CTAYLR_007740 [Chrysophaeum taylorii]